MGPERKVIQAKTTKAATHRIYIGYLNSQLSQSRKANINGMLLSTAFERRFLNRRLTRWTLLGLTP
jgi:hypothetical protein